MFWCRTLGKPTLFADGPEGELLVQGGKGLAILVYLLLTPRHEESKDRITELFWPESAEPLGHHSLRQILYRFRKHTNDEQIIHADDSTVRCTAPVVLDVLEGEQALESDEPERAFALLRGSFLDGEKIEASREFAEWTESQGARFKECFARAGEIVVERALTMGDPERAVAVAEEVRSLNPLLERRVELLIRTLDGTGQAGRAVAEFRAYAELLQQALSDSPSAQLTRYCEELERSLEPRPVAASTDLPFVGRGRAWTRLMQGWEAVRQGRCATVLLEGDAGIGKTRLIDEFARRVMAGDGTWLAARCYEIEQSLPHATVARIARSGSDPESGCGPPEVDTSPATGRDAFIARLRSEADGTPVLLTCDDIHWADAASLRLLHFARDALAGERIMMILSYRPGELSLAARQFAGSLAASGRARIVTLEPLSVNDIRDMLLVMGDFDDKTGLEVVAEQMWRHTGGNALFLDELLSSLGSAGTLRVVDGCWQGTAALDTAELPKTLRKILSDRVDALDDLERLALETVAVLGRAASVDVVAAVIDASSPATEALLTSLASARLLRCSKSRTYEAAHDELRQLVYGAIPDHRRREIHGRVAAALEVESEALQPGGAGRLSRHFEQAEEWTKARELALLAAREAGSAGAADARRQFLHLADAYQATLAGRLAGDKGAGPVKRRAPRGFVYFAAGVVLAAVVGSRWLGESAGDSQPSWQQGTLYISRHEPQPNLPAELLLYRVEWPRHVGEEAQLVGEPVRPTALPPLLLQPVVPGAGSHTKLFRVRGPDTVAFTDGSFDEQNPVWSPDRRQVAFMRGWRVDDDYRFNIFVADSLGQLLRQLTDGSWQDQVLDWSPDGGRIAFARDDGALSVWLTDADGARQENITTLLGPLEATIGGAAFSPDSRMLAVSDPNSPDITLVDLHTHHVRHLTPGCELRPGLAWSPDGRWIAFTCRAGSEVLLSVVDALQGAGVVRLATLPLLEWQVAAWTGPGMRYVDTVRTDPARIEIPVGLGRRVHVVVRDPAGRGVQTTLRWHSLDSSIACVDSLGFVRARRPGTTRIVASAGGFRTDTASVTVVFGAADTVLYETWGRGIDSTLWHIVGEPAPETVRGAGENGGAAFLSNGDDRWPSGVLSRAEFDLTNGLTIEFPMSLRFTGSHWQELEVRMSAPAHALLGGNERTAGPAPVIFWIAGPSPSYRTAMLGCNDGALGGLGSRELPEHIADGNWHRVALQIRPDHLAECYIDGDLVARYEISEGAQTPTGVLFIGGRSYETRIYHGPVLVTRGLRY